MILNEGDSWDISWEWTHVVVTVSACELSHYIVNFLFTRDSSQNSMTLNGRQRRMQAKLQDSRSFRVLDDSTAAVLRYGLGETGSESSLKSSWRSRWRHIWCISPLSKEGVFEELATARDTHIRGDNCDIYYLVKAYDKKKPGRMLVATNALWANWRRPWYLWNAHGRCSVVEIDSFENGKGFSETLTRAEFEELNLVLFKRRWRPAEQVLELLRVKSTRYGFSSARSAHSLILLVLDRPGWWIYKNSHSKVNEPSRGINVHLLGWICCLFCCWSSGHFVSSQSMISLCLILLNGIEVTGEVFANIIKRNTGIPAKKCQMYVFSFFLTFHFLWPLPQLLNCCGNQPTVMKARVRRNSSPPWRIQVWWNPTGGREVLFLILK